MRGTEDQALGGLARWARIGGLVVLAWLTLGFARTGMSGVLMESWLHLPDLIFHEAGHFLFAPFGRFMTVLGGSLFQCLLPVLLAVAFLRQQDAFGAAVCTWWAGQNLVDVSPYIADARALRMPLIGGGTGAEVEGHDWEFLLTELNWLHLDRAIGTVVFRLGLLVMVAALAWGAYAALRTPAED